ncbi:TlpA family protein disulfide reductase [Arachidicoccus sp.]|uniref:TlpA family protein disulfide reductase n=1 Tax=Arachidicoccus sp. TaxID=1872624 RepID=UPI003D1D6809
MKKQLISNKYCFLLLILCIACCKFLSAAPLPTTVFGRVCNYDTRSVALYEVKNGALVRLGFRWLKEDGGFKFEFPLEKEAIFFIAKSSAHPGNFKNVIYIKPGDKMQLRLYSNNISLDYDSCKIKFENQETKLLQQWVNWFNTTCKDGPMAVKRNDFFSAYAELQSTVAAFKKSARTSNSYFNTLFKEKIDVDMDFARAAAFFYFNDRMNSGYDTVKSHRGFYLPLVKEGKYDDALLLNTDHGMALLKYYTSLNRFFKTGDTKDALLTDISMVGNDTLKGAMVIDYMYGVVSYEAFEKEIVPFEKYFFQAEMKQAYEKKKEELLPFSRGTQAYNFSLRDRNSKMVSLSDFKGKVVVLDMWAMWCAPCLKEKPYFRKTEEDFKNNKKIVFVSISVDGNVKKDAWRAFIVKKGWNGIELLSEYDQSLMKYYHIEGIPRFMIFDKEGKIVSVDAPRPSADGFRTLIEQTLKGN